MIFIKMLLSAAAAEAPASPADVVRPGQWSTNQSLCAGHCKAIYNQSKTDCVAFGFKNGGLDTRLGHLTVTDGQGNGYGVLTADHNGDGLLDFKSCLPPQTTAWGNVDGLGPVVQIESIKYATGTSHYPMGPFQSMLDTTKVFYLEIYGSYYTGTGEAILSSGRPGSAYNTYTLSRYAILNIGG